MISMILRRLALAVPMLLIVSFLVFSLVALVPGDAAVTLAGGTDARPEDVEAVRQELNLDEPFLSQYGTWLSKAVRFDFGNSLYSGRPITDEIGRRLPATLSLAAATVAVMVPLALVVGVLGGLRPGSRRDRALVVLASTGIAVPTFWFALVLVGIFSVSLGWLPPFGYVAPSDDPVEWMRRICIPAVALGTTSGFVLSRQVRAGLADTMRSAFVRTAWAKGGTPRRVVGGHALKPSAIPAVTVLGIQVSAIVSGAVIIEEIFVIPGIGSFLLTAVNNQDIPVIQAAALLFVLIHVAANLAVDIAYGFLNPKVRAS